MERYTIEQCVVIVGHYFKNESFMAIVRKFHIKYVQNSVLSSSSVHTLIEKCRESGSVGDTEHTAVGSS